MTSLNDNMMNINVSYAFYGINRSEKNPGFQIYGNWGFIDEISKDQRYALFQTPSEISLYENEEIYSVFLIDAEKYSILLINHHWYTGISQGNRNCYDGFSMILKVEDQVPNIIDLTSEFINHEELIKSKGIDYFQKTSKSTLSIQDAININKQLKRSKKISMELYSPIYTNKEIIFDILDSLININFDKYKIFSTTNISLFDRVTSPLIEKNNHSDTQLKEPNYYFKQIKEDYDQITAIKNDEINKKKLELRDLENKLFATNEELKKIIEKFKNVEKENEKLINDLSIKKNELASLIRRKKRVSKKIIKSIWVVKNKIATLLFIGIVIGIIIGVLVTLLEVFIYDLIF